MLRKTLVLFTILLMLSLCACKSEEPSVEAAETDGFLSMQNASTGGAPAENANLKELLVEGDREGTTLSLSFVLGSRISSIDEAASPSVPSYKAYFTQQPLRLVLEFEDVDFWDYTRTLNLPVTTMLHGIVRQTFTANNKFMLVFQLRSAVEYSIEEKGSVLYVSLRTPQSEPTEAPAPQEGNAWFITTNQTGYLGEGLIPQGAGLLPTLCTDISSTLLISDPYESEEAALQAQRTLYSRVPALTAGQLTIVQLGKNALPQYDASLDFVQVTGLEVIRRGGASMSLPALVPDGIYLATAPDGTILYNKQIIDDESGDDALDTEELWTIDALGRSKMLSEIEFGAIEKAEFSPDGKRLALLELAGESSYLHIFDMEAGRLTYNLAEEGLGNNTRNFVWDTMGTAIYAISGQGSGKLYLQKYDFTIPDETARISLVEEEEANEGDLGFFGGEVYFTHVSDEGKERIFRIKPEGGLRTAFAEGTGFRISSDGRYMAVFEASAATESDEDTINITHLKIVDVATGEESYVVRDAAIVSYGFGADGTLYYITALSADAPLAFPYELWSYKAGGQSVSELELISYNFTASPNAFQLYLPYVSTGDDAPHIRATYVLDFNTLVAGQE